MSNRIFISGLGHNIATEEAKAYFSQFGFLTECQVLMDKTTGINIHP